MEVITLRYDWRYKGTEVCGVTPERLHKTLGYKKTTLASLNRMADTRWTDPMGQQLDQTGMLDAFAESSQLVPKLVK